MNIGGYSIDWEKIYTLIQNNKYDNILLQLPDGLKYYAESIKNQIQSMASVQVYISGDTCFGACDIPCTEYLKHLGVEAIFQIGHSPISTRVISSLKLPIFFVDAHYICNVDKLMLDALKFLIGKNIGIVTTAQHLPMLNTVASILKSNKFEPIISKGDNRIEHAGQILGCNTSALKNILDRIDSILFLGSGIFHPIALLLSTHKPVIQVDPVTKMIQRDELIPLKEKILKKRYIAIAHAKQSKSFGILLSSKPGQQQYKKVIKCKKILETKKKNFSLFIVDHISPYSLEQFPYIDCFISTACPRIVIDDSGQYKKPIITPNELEISFEMKPYEAYQFDEITE